MIRRRDKQKIIWEVVEEVHPVVPSKERKNIGLKDFDLLCPEKDTIFADLLLHLSPLPWEQEVQLINEAIRKSNATTSRAIHEFTPHEYFIGRAILIGAACFCEKGVHLWADHRRKKITYVCRLVQARRISARLLSFDFSSI